MAAKKSVNIYPVDVEPTVNRWVVDFYFVLALERFDNNQYEDFCGIRHVLDSVLDRPLEITDVMRTKIRILQFLSRINDGEKLDMSFESDQSLTPLESALVLLESMHDECSMTQKDFENVCDSLKEMMVWMFIKNNQFDKAKEMLVEHFPKPTVGKKAIFMDLINKKTKMHEVVEQVDFLRFKAEMLAFCKSLCSFSVPFLHKAATQLIDERLAQEDKAAAPDEQDEAGPSSSPQINTVQLMQCKCTVMQRTRLELAYNALAAGSDERTFAQLEEEVEGEEQGRQKDISLCLSPSPTSQESELDGLFQRDSGSPMEASPADQPPQTDAVPQTQSDSLSKMPSVQLYTVARLVVEPDSQGGSQCSSASQELVTDVRTEEPPQSPAIPTKKDPQSPVTDTEVTEPTRNLRRQANRFCSSALTILEDSEEGPPSSLANLEISAGKRHNKSNNSLSSNSTKSKQLSSSSSSSSSSDCQEEPQESWPSCKTPVRKPCKQLANDLHSKAPDVLCNTDSSLDSSPNLFPVHPVPQKSSTPHKNSVQDEGPSHSKWKQLISNAKESKETWSDEESCVAPRKSTGSHNESTISNSGHRKRKWSESETNKLKEGVKKFGEGNWCKIKSYYSFSDRTNVNLKDRWRTLKKLNQV